MQPTAAPPDDPELGDERDRARRWILLLFGASALLGLVVLRLSAGDPVQAVEIAPAPLTKALATPPVEPPLEPIPAAPEVVAAVQQVAPSPPPRSARPRRWSVRRAEAPSLSDVLAPNEAASAPERFPIPASEVRRVVQQNRQHVAACHQQELKAGRVAPGKVVLALTVGRDGTVSSTEIGAPRDLHGPLARCLTLKARGWHFSADQRRSSQRVLVPFFFVSS